MRFGFFRGVVVLGAAILIGVGLWWLISRTRFGKIVRAGVDDRDMVSASGSTCSSYSRPRSSSAPCWPASAACSAAR